MTEWLESLTYNNLRLSAVGSIPTRDFGIFHMRYQASFRNDGGYIQVPARALNNARRDP